MANDTAAQAADLRAEAARHYTEAADSFERCDTDGFLSQWASGLTGDLRRREADLLEAGGVADFTGLFTTDGRRVAAKLIDGRYGLCWAFCDERGKFTGVFVSAFSKGKKKRAEMGLVEAKEKAPAQAVLRGNTAVNVRAVYERTDGGYPPDAVVL